MSQQLWIATTNKGKFSELRDILGALPFELHGAHELPHFTPPRETASTFVDNARIKAKSLNAMKPDCYILSDDSGLEVTALNNLPGVHSARYAGPNARDVENNLKLLKQIQVQSTGLDRSAQFVCHMVLLTPTGEERVFKGFLKGMIGKEIKGKYGFGYDPVFVPEGQTQTLAELGTVYKVKFSHRAIAAKQVVEFLKSL